jgi:hypothetical protein
MKRLTNYETCTESRLPIFVIGRFSPVVTSHWTAERIYVQCYGRVTEQFLESQSGSGAIFALTGGFLNPATSSLKRGLLEGFFKLFKAACINLAYNFLSNKAKNILLNHQLI